MDEKQRWNTMKDMVRMDMILQQGEREVVVRKVVTFVQGFAIVGALWLGSLLVTHCSSNSSDTDGGDGGQVCSSQCTTYEDCAEDQDCRDGCCTRAKRCTQDVTCQPDGAKCVNGRCVGLCVNDTDCAEGYFCDYGFCEQYPQDVMDAFKTPPPDDQQTQKQPLQVGIGEVFLDFPVGVSLAGFGARVGPHTPYRKTLGGSERVWDKPRVKAFVLDNGRKRIAIVRTATGWSTDYLVTRAAWDIYQATGENWINRIITSATHTHSYPGRFSFWIPDRSMGVLGHGDYSQEMLFRHADAIAKAVMAAEEDLKPAKLAWTYIENMDPDRKVHQYRRGEYQTEMDDSMVTIRIDDMDGNPRALLFNFGLHGTHSNDTAVTGDAPGAVELIAELKLQDLTGLPVVTGFLSGDSGDISPAGDGNGLDDWRKIQQVGLNAWPIIKAQYDAMEGKTTSDVDLDIASIRAPINRQVLGYGPGEFIDEDGAEYAFGAFQCVVTGDDDPSTKYSDGALGCIFSAQMLSGGVPVSPFCKVRISLLRIGDLGFTTVAGEPLSKFGRDLHQELLDAGFTGGHVLGYSQDHHLYVMHADNWLQGGYEPSMGIWGWAEGDYFFSVTTKAIERFGQEGGFVQDNGMVPSWYPWHDDTVPPTRTDPADAGAIIQDVPDTVERSTMVRFFWTGGHPGVDLPSFSLEKNNGGQWEPVLNAAGVAYNDILYSSMTWYRGDYDSDHTWELEWEEGMDFPAGEYRIRIDGHFFDGSGVQQYSTTSSAFDFVPSTRLVITDVSMSGNQISGAVLYPSGPTNDDGTSSFDTLEPTGYLWHSDRVPPYLPYPVSTDGSVTVTVGVNPPNAPALTLDPVAVSSEAQVDYTFVNSRTDQGEETTATASVPAGTFSADYTPGQSGTYTLVISVEDSQGNTGHATVEVAKN